MTRGHRSLLLSAVLWMGLPACGGAEEGTLAEDAGSVEPVSVDTSGGEHVALPWFSVVDTLQFTSLVEDGIAPGFNVDGVVSEEGDPDSCGHGDFVSPDGEEGIDNQLALITPLLDFVGLGAVHGLVQGAIEEGGLLIMFQLDGLDDPVNDDDVQVMLRFGHGTPLLGTDGLLLSGQTFHVHPDSPDLSAPDARVEDGVLTTGAFEIRIPIVVFGVKYELTVRDAMLRATLTYDGGMVDGLLGGHVPMSDLWEIAEVAETMAGGILDAFTLVVGNMPDSAPDEDGACQELSAALSFTGVSGFLFTEEY